MPTPRLALALLAVLVAAPAAHAQAVIPTVSCVEETDDGRYRAYFGYESLADSVLTVPLGHDNRYQGGRTEDAPPTEFLPGVQPYAFEATFENRLTWVVESDGTRRMVRADQRHPEYNECEPPSDSDNEPESDGVLELDGVRPDGFNAVGAQPLVVRVEGATFALDPDAHRLVVNGTYLVPTAVTPTEARFDLVLQPGRNELSVYAMDAEELGMTARSVLWAGASTKTVAVTDEAGSPLDGALVRMAIVDDLGVGVEGTTSGGQVTFSNVPPRTLIVTAEAAPNRFGTAGALGDGAPVTIVALGFEAPSAVANNDFSLGLEGWDVTSGVSDGSVDLIPFVADPGPDGDFPAEESPNDGAALGAVPAPFSTAAAASATDLDLQLATGGEGPQRVSRSFQVEPGTRNVTVRYRFETSEVPGGYYGSEFNDYFGVTLRSQTAGGRSSEQNSMNGLGLAAFDGAGVTAWREVDLPVAEDGDLVQVDLVVANVGDGLYPSRLVVDRVEETPLSITTARLKDNSLFRQGLKSCHGGTLLEPLQYFSMGSNNTFNGGNTWVWGDLTLEGEPGDAVTDVRLEAVWNGRVVTSGPLSNAARADLIRPFGSSGRLTTSQSGNTPLFAVPGSEYPARDASITLRVRAETASGRTATRTVGEFPILVLYVGSNRFGSAARDAEQGGDGWARRSAALWGLRISRTAAGSGLLFNDWANMNGGKFPIHCTHRTGEIVDATYPGLPNKNAAAAQALIDMLNTSHGNRVEKVQTTYSRGGSFAQTLANAGTLTDGRRATDVVSILGGHPTHMHVTLFSGGGTAGGGAQLASLSAEGQAWTERGPRGDDPRTADRAGLEAPVGGPLAVEVAPNPVAGRSLAVRVAGGVEARAVRLEVYDLVGRRVLEATAEASTASIDVSRLAPGAYVLRATAGGEVATSRFVVAR